MPRPRLFTEGMQHAGWRILRVSRKVRNGSNLLECEHENAPGIIYELSTFQFKSGATRLNRTLSHTWADKLSVSHSDHPNRNWSGVYVPIALLELPVEYFADPGIKVFVGRNGDKAMYRQEDPEEIRNYHMAGMPLLITDYPATAFVNAKGADAKTAAREIELMTTITLERKELARIERVMLRQQGEYTTLRNTILARLHELHGDGFRIPDDLPPALPGSVDPEPAAFIIPPTTAERGASMARDDWSAENLQDAIKKQASRHAPDAEPDDGSTVYPFMSEAQKQANTPTDTRTLPLPLDDEKELVQEPLKASDQTDLPKAYAEPFVIPEPSAKKADTPKPAAPKAAVPDSTFDDDEFAGFPPPSGFVRPKNTTGIHQNFGTVPQWEMAPHLYANFNGKARQWVEMTDEEILSIGGLTKLQGRTQRREHLIRKD